MNKIYNIGLIFILLLVTSCNDWLDVRSKMEVKKEDLLVNYKGVRDALTGCYISLNDRKIYGEKLTMTNIESLANLWDVNSYTNLKDHKALSNHDYSNEQSRIIFSDFYASLYNVIAQANLIIESLESDGNIIENDNIRDVLLGEAYAIRGFCHFDILRLYGQMPKGGSKTVDLPYAFKASISEYPQHYSFNDFVSYLKEDFKSAEALLKDKDPVFKYTFKQLNSSEYIQKLEDKYLGYRQSRINYWAVRGLQARLALYLGEESEAYTIATSIINATGPDGSPVMALSGSSDLPNNNFACPNECLFVISKFNILDYSRDLLFGGTSSARVNFYKNYLLTKPMLNDLFANRSTANNNRYLFVWNKSAKSSDGVEYPAIKKYDYSDSDDDKMTLHQIIPILRMSEIYLIAIETAPSLTESNSLFKTYMESHDESIVGDAFASKEDLRNKILDAYRLEFFGEGQMFYTYKRVNAQNILWYSRTMTEDDYIIPLPAGESNIKSY